MYEKAWRTTHDQSRSWRIGLAPKKPVGSTWCDYDGRMMLHLTQAHLQSIGAPRQSRVRFTGRGRQAVTGYHRQ